MRLSTAQIFQQGISSILDQQARLQKTEQQLATGRRVLTPADDPVAAVQILDISQDLEQLDQFQRNGNLAQGQLALEESVLENVGNVLQRVRELVVQANNASQSAEARHAIGTEVAARVDELQALANTRDASGEYIFAGFQAEAEPFTKVAGSVVYNGDAGQRHLQLGASAQIAVRDSGRDVFMAVSSGNGTFAIAPAAGNSGTAVAGSSSVTGTYVRDTYTISFNQPTAADPLAYEIRDGGGSVVDAGLYEAGGSYGAGGASVAIDGVPADGDSFTIAPSTNRDVFATIQGIADTLTGAGSAPAQVAALNNALGQGLQDLDQSLGQILEVRSDVGVRLARVESQHNSNADFTLQLQQTLSEVQELDYAEAISRLNLQITALQAAQQAYVKVQGLSLFNFL